jgi:hypothetical protein
MTRPSRLRWVWPVLLLLLTGLLVCLRFCEVLDKYFQPWGVVAIGTLLIALTGQAAGRVLRGRRRDTLPLWLVILLLGGGAAALLAQPGDALSSPLAIAGWALGLGLAGFPVGFEV